MANLVTVSNTIKNKGKEYATNKYGKGTVSKAESMKPFWNKDNKAELTRRIKKTESLHGTKGQKPSVTGQNLLKDMKTNYKARFGSMSGGGGRAAAIGEVRGGLSKSIQAKKLLPNV